MRNIDPQRYRESNQVLLVAQLLETIFPKVLEIKHSRRTPHEHVCIAVVWGGQLKWITQFQNREMGMRPLRMHS